MDKLDTVFMMQRKFMDDLEARRKLDETPEVWVQKYTLAMISKLSELLDEVNFKWWKNAKPIDKDATKDELVDILHFFVSMCIKMDMDADELLSRYIAKNKENFDRQNGLSAKAGYQSPEVNA